MITKEEVPVVVVVVVVVLVFLSFDLFSDQNLN